MADCIGVKPGRLRAPRRRVLRALGAALLAASACGVGDAPASLVPAASGPAEASLDRLVEPGATCEELQRDYAFIRQNGEQTCSSDDQCRCSKGGVIPARLCGAVDFRTSSRLFDAIHQRFVASGCRENWCSGRPCRERCDWTCTPVCRAGECVNATGPDER